MAMLENFALIKKKITTSTLHDLFRYRPLAKFSIDKQNLSEFFEMQFFSAI
jgi:hypothetical protein